MLSFLDKCWCHNNSYSELPWIQRCLQLTCLRPSYSLRQQLMAGYGITAFITVFIVAIISISAAVRGGNNVRIESTELFETQLDAVLQESGVLMGDILDKKMNSLRGSVNLLVEIVRDRIVGYPNDGWENDIHVPFLDQKTGRQAYPFKADLLPRDWMVTPNINVNDTDSVAEHLQERGDDELLLQVYQYVNTETPMFYFQGNCNPNLTKVDHGYYPFCTDENNDASIGGKINPTKTLAPLEQKAADVGVFMKAIFEAQPLALNIGMTFANSGAGATVRYPSFYAPLGEFVSEGCDWMRETNKLTNRSLGTEEEIKRCSQAGEVKSLREYNVLETSWCADQALNPGDTRIYGPYDASSWDGWRLTIGKAVFDRITKEFIGCAYIDVGLNQAEDLLADISEDINSDMVVTKLDGTVIAGVVARFYSNETNFKPKLWETDFIDLDTYNDLTDNLAFWEGEWDIESARRKYNFSVESNGKYYTVFPSPDPPEEYDPLYRPDFFIFGSIDAEVQDDTIDKIGKEIRSGVDALIIIIVTLGALGFCCMMTVVTIVAQLLTRPLKWMESKAWEIVNHNDKRVGKSLVVASEDVNQIHFFSFLPKTEIQELVSEFRSMISGFSGEGACRVAISGHAEIKNFVTWKEDFRNFYNLNPMIDQQLQEEKGKFRQSVSRRMSKQMVLRRSSAGAMRRSSRARISFRDGLFSDSLSNSLREDPSQGGPMRDGRSSLSRLSMADFAQILAAANEVAEDDDSAASGQQLPTSNSSPSLVAHFRSTQMAGEPTNESPTAPFMSAMTVMSSATLSAAKPINTQKPDFEAFPRPPTRLNLGSNIQHTTRSRKTPSEEERNAEAHNIDILRSPLYWNVLCWIVVPLLASLITIIVFVQYSLTGPFTNWIQMAEDTSFDLGKKHLKSSTDLIVKHIEQIFVEPIHDLHTITRMSGWLLFGAVGMSDSFTDIEMEAVDDCKYYEEFDECPYKTNGTRTPCFCEWNDPWQRTCDPDLTVEENDPRYKQKLWFVNQRRDLNQSFPDIFNMANQTFWYTNPDDLQGSNNAGDGEVLSTPYNRMRAAAALSTIIFPVYNYGTETRADGIPSSALSGYISFEADGTYGGFSGCNYIAGHYATFVSDDGNKAYEIDPELCPKGKYGYDPRCRGWYDNAKKQYLTNGDGLYITPPYKFAAEDDIGTTLVSPLFEPKSGQFIGNSLTDLSTSEIAEIIDKSKAEYYGVILPNATDGQNLIFSNVFLNESEPQSVYELYFEYDEPDSPNVERFREIIRDMENEGTGQNCSLFRTSSEGEEEEYCYVYKPFYNRELRPVQSDDFSRGSMHYTEFLYSVILFMSVDDVVSEYNKESYEIDRILEQTATLSILATTITTLICVIVTAMVSFYITRPMIQLLHIVKQVNAGRIEDNMPPLSGGSREVHQVYTSFARLYKTVRMSNSAFFGGDLNLAFRIALDALNLFRKIGDEKAIAIACNNMGNTLLAWMVESGDAGTMLELEDDDCTSCLQAAIKYYTEAVVAGTEDFEEASGDAEKSKFAQQLADRHFNRAMCLLLTAGDASAASNAKEAGLDDLFLAWQYDQGVKEYMLHSKTLLDNSDVIFERSLRRLHGLAALMDVEPEVWDVWDIHDLVDHADLMLQAAWGQDDAPIFRNMTKIGRLQELEGAVIGIELGSGKSNDAVHLATRMLIEDEYLLDSSFIEAADCILQYSQENKEHEDDDDDDDDDEDITNEPFKDESITKLKQEFKTMRKPGMRNALDIGRAFIFCIDLKGDWNGRPVLAELQKMILKFYEENFQPNDTVGIVTFVPNDGTLNKIQPSSVRDLTRSGKYPHREALIAATTGVACSRFCPALEGGIEMALDVESSSASDVCLLYVADGGAYNEKIFSDLRNKLEASSRNGTPRVRSKSRSFSSPSSIDFVAINLGGTYEKTFASEHFLAPQTVVTFEESCKSLVLATRSRASVFLEADPENLGEAFRQATASINEGTSFAGNRLQRALTMQKF